MATPSNQLHSALSSCHGISFNQLLSTLLAHHGNSFKAIILFSCPTITTLSNHFWYALFAWQILILCEVFT
jgi:hypothetical protein